MAIAVSDYRALTVTEAKTKITDAGLRSKVVGNGEVVIEQFPKPTTEISPDGIIVLYTGSDVPSANVTVPNCVGLSASQVNRAIINSNLNIIMEGSHREGVNGAQAVAVSQSPAAGEKVYPGTVITVSFKHLDGTD